MSALADLVGVELGPTSWIDVPQERINLFADATGDPQWIHVDPEKAAAGPFGTTIAHGFLTLALCVPMLYELLPPGDGMVVNYGVNKVRFPAAVCRRADGYVADSAFSLSKSLRPGSARRSRRGSNARASRSPSALPSSSS